MKYTIMGLVGICLTVILFLSIGFFLSDGPTDQVQERNKQPLENRLEHLEELIEIQSTKNDEAQSVLDRTVIIASIYRDMRDEMLGDQGLQVKTTVLDYAPVVEVLEVVEVVEVQDGSRFIQGGKHIPSAISGNTKEKRFHNFVGHFARGFDSSVFVEARNRYGVKEEVLACIARADSDMGNANKSTNNIMNYGNNDRGQTRAYNSVLDSVMGAAHGLSQGRYLSRNKLIGGLSGGGREYLGMQSCSVPGQYCYATSQVNWRRNVNNCLTFIEGEKKDWDTLGFKK